MAIDMSAKWWIGNQPDDLDQYWRAYSADCYPVDEFRLARCECGSVEFRLEADDVQGTARRTCMICNRQHLICDSGEYWDNSSPEAMECLECRSTRANVGVGFALYEDKQSVKWVYIGVRCADCGILGCFAGWKIGYEPSLQLMDQV